jgi:hypothetical protein
MAKRKGGKSSRSSGGSKSPRKVSRAPRPLGVVARRVATVVPRRVATVVPRRVAAVVPRRVVPAGRVVAPRVIPAPRVVTAPVRRLPLRPPIMGTGVGAPLPPVPPVGPMGPVPGMMPAGRGTPSMTIPTRGMPRAPLAPFPRGRRF